MQVHCFDFKSFMSTLTFFKIIFFPQREGLHIQWRHSVSLVFPFFFSRSKIIYLLRFKLFLTIFKCIYVSFFLLYLFADSDYICIAVNKKSFSFVEHKVHACSFFFFSPISGNANKLHSDLWQFAVVKEESRADHRGHIGLCGLSAISALWRTIILSALSALASASVSRTMLIHPRWIPFHRSSVVWWTAALHRLTSQNSDSLRASKPEPVTFRF